MPTYRNDSTTESYVVTGTDGLRKTVAPGETVETYDTEVPSDFTETLATPRISVNMSGEDEWTDSICPKGPLNISISGEFVGTVALQRSRDSFVTPKEVDVFNSSIETVIEDVDPHYSYRIGLKEYTSGAVVVELSK